MTPLTAHPSTGDSVPTKRCQHSAGDLNLATFTILEPGHFGLTLDPQSGWDPCSGCGFALVITDALLLSQRR